ncbi:MAG: ATP-binding protein, partial [Bacteroidetes bacterium]|nr:ATP-binding protein [Bacteroidota bacterium]
MHTEIEILNALEALAETLAGDDRTAAREGIRRCGEMLGHSSSEEELVALAVLARETQRGNHLTDIPSLHGATKRTFGLSIRWDNVLASLVDRKLVLILEGEGRECGSGVDVIEAFGHGDRRQFQIALRLHDPNFDAKSAKSGYASNKEYLQDCFQYIDLLSDGAVLHRSGKRQRHDSREDGETLRSRYASLRAKAGRTNPLPPVEELAARLALDKNEWTMLLFVLRRDLDGAMPEVQDLIRLTGSEDIFDQYSTREYFRNSGKLITQNVFEIDRNYPLMSQDVMLTDTVAEWLIHGGEAPVDLWESGTAEHLTPFGTNEEYLMAWCDLARQLLLDDDDDVPRFVRRRRRQQQASQPAADMPEVSNILKRIDISTESFPLEMLAEEAQLDIRERIILALGVFVTLRGDDLGTQYAAKLLAGKDYFDAYRYARYFREDAPLLQHGLIELQSGFRGSTDYDIPSSVLSKILDEETPDAQSGRNFSGSQFFEQRTPAHDLSSAILSCELRENLRTALDSVKSHQIETLRTWGIEQITASRPSGSVLLLFHGPAGTGKTYTAEAFAGSLDAGLLVTDAGKILTMWYGESESRMQRMFASYRKLAMAMEQPPVLLLNECDQLLATRHASNGGRSTDQTEHRLQNILLEELERFPGILIATTNLVDSLDEAFSRRFDYKIFFDNPDAPARLALWEK